MNRALISTLALSSLLLVSCGQSNSDESKLSAIFTDTVCLAQFGADAAKTAGATGSGQTFDMAKFREDMDAKAKGLQEKMKSSFAKEADMKDAYKAIADKDAFKKQVASSAAAQCQGQQEVVDRVFTEIDKDIQK